MSASPSALTTLACVSVAQVDAQARTWFDRRTTRAADWPVSLLRREKGATTVSVVLPCLDEQETVGRIVERIRRDLVDRHALVDELVVVDSGSTDLSLQRAAAAGATVVRREDVLAEFAPLPGKGEAMWRGVAATTGDVVVFVDSDLRDFSTSFVTGMLGPLLTDSTVQFVKATYDRPLQHGETLLPTGGGRVTELVARPLIALHWPQLAGFVQPLGGEYAARRPLLESLPFPTGYGVEFGLLVDTWRAVGLDAMAQVDLSRRKHRNSDLHKLGRMATEILLVAERRLGREATAAALTQFARAGEGYELVETELAVSERPPLTSFPIALSRATRRGARASRPR
jgi:glucosyl-3-phosphoglycerate synthase